MEVRVGVIVVLLNFFLFLVEKEAKSEEKKAARNAKWKILSMKIQWTTWKRASKLSRARAEKRKFKCELSYVVLCALNKLI